jgi:hypothetical protein
VYQKEEALGAPRKIPYCEGLLYQESIVEEDGVQKSKHLTC